MSNKKPIDIVVAGHICLDIIPTFEKSTQKTLDEVLVPGKLMNVSEAVLSTGGPVANTGLGLSKLGTRVEFMAKVGDDLFGNATVGIMEYKTGARSKGIRKIKGEFSSYTIVIAPPGIDRIFLHAPGTNNTFGHDDINFDLLKQAKVFHLGYPPLLRKLYLNNGKELIRIFRKVKSLGLTTSLDLALPDPSSESGQVDWDIIFRNLLPYVDLFLPGMEETMYMVNPRKYHQLKNKSLKAKKDIADYFSGADFSDISDILLEDGAKIIGLKCSHRGYYLRTADKDALSNLSFVKRGNWENWANRELWAPSYQVSKIASATGSGDSAVAGFLAAFLKGEDIENTIKYANAVGAQNLRAYDGVSGLGTWKEVQEMVKSKNTRINKLRIVTPGWHWDKEMKIWRGPNDGK